MKHYELALLISPHLAEPEVKELTEKVKKLLKENGGQIIGDESWGKKNLAYPVNKENQGFYEFIYFSLDPHKLIDIEKKLKLENKILRFMICRLLEKVALQSTSEKENPEKTETSETKQKKTVKKTTTKKQAQPKTKKTEEDTYKELEAKLKEILEE